MYESERSWYRILAIVLCGLFFLSYLLPEWVTAVSNQLNFYSNAWDEANYLTHQMALNLRYSPSYWFGENIYLLLECFGLSGSWQNILFDTFLPPMIVISTAWILKKILSVSIADALIYALLIWFSSVLFSHAHQFPDDKSFFITAVYTFPAFLRTPNPQISYSLICLFIALFIRFRKWYLLLIPLPFLYFPIFIGYFYLLIAWYSYQFFAEKKFWFKFFLANLVSSVALILMLIIFTQLLSIKEFLLFSRLTNGSAYLLSSSRHIQLPLIFLLFTPLVPILLCYCSKFTDTIKFFYLTFLLALLVCANTQLITGILFAPKIFQSDFAVILAGLMLVIFLYCINPFISQFLKFSSLVVALMIVLVTQGFSFIDFSYEIKKYPKFTAEQLQFLKNSPFILITGYDADFYAQFLPYAVANIYSPLQSIHYTYLSFISDCGFQNDFFKQAIRQAEILPDSYLKEDLLKDLKRNYHLSTLITEQMPIHFLNLNYCTQKLPVEFPVIDMKEKVEKIKFKIF